MESVHQVFNCVLSSKTASDASGLLGRHPAAVIAVLMGGQTFVVPEKFSQQQPFSLDGLDVLVTERMFSQARKI